MYKLVDLVTYSLLGPNKFVIFFLSRCSNLFKIAFNTFVLLLAKILKEEENFSINRVRDPILLTKFRNKHSLQIEVMPHHIDFS